MRNTSKFTRVKTRGIFQNKQSLSAAADNFIYGFQTLSIAAE